MWSDIKNRSSMHTPGEIFISTPKIPLIAVPGNSREGSPLMMPIQYPKENSPFLNDLKSYDSSSNNSSHYEEKDEIVVKRI